MRRITISAVVIEGAVVPGTSLSPAMAARYGEGRRSPGLIAGIVVLALVFFSIIGLVTYRLATNQVQSDLLRFVVVDDSRVDVTFDVRRDSQSETVCVLRAQDTHHADVGYATVRITAGRDHVTATYPLATLARAASADVLGCASGTAPRVDAPSFLPGTTNPSQIPTIDGS